MYVSSLCKSMDYIMDLFGVLGLTIGLLGFAASGTQYVISYIIQPKSNVFYYIAFGIGVIFEVLCFLIASVEKSEKFEFIKEEDKMRDL